MRGVRVVTTWLQMLFVVHVVDQAYGQSIRCILNDPAQQLKLDVLMSAYITDVRARAKNRFPRLSIFRYTLYSYSRLPLDRVHLFIKLEEKWKPLQLELGKEIHTLFGRRLQTLEWDRLVSQQSWRRVVRNLCDHGDRLVLFMQNDDHVFIDSDTRYLVQSLEVMRNHGALFKTMWISHWIEGLFGLGIKGPATANVTATLVSDMIRVETSHPESFQVVNAAYLNYLFVDLDWVAMKWAPGLKGFWRTDDVFVDMKGDDGKHLDLSQGAFTGTRNKQIQTTFIPLREVVRKFNGYSDRWVSEISRLLPPLVLPPSQNRYHAGLEVLRHRLSNIRSSPGSPLNLHHDETLRLPEEWVNASLALHERHPYPFGQRMLTVPDRCCDTSYQGHSSRAQ